MNTQSEIALDNRTRRVAAQLSIDPVFQRLNEKLELEKQAVVKEMKFGKLSARDGARIIKQIDQQFYSKH